MPAASPIEKRLDKHSMPEPMTGCVLWIGAARAKGYGFVQFRGAVRAAHRVSYEVNIGPIPDGLHVLHRCDTPACINPSHLFLGTNVDNIRDKVTKGRARKPTGTASPHAKLRSDDIQVIRARKLLGESAPAIARDYGVTKNTILRACRPLEPTARCKTGPKSRAVERAHLGPIPEAPKPADSTELPEDWGKR